MPRRAVFAWSLLVGLLAACGSANTDVIPPEGELDDPRARPDASTPSNGSSSGSPSGSSGAVSGSSSSGGGTGTSSSSGAAIDAGPEGCDPGWALTPVEAVGGAPQNIGSFSLTGDERSMYYTLDGKLYAASRGGLGDSFADALQLPSSVIGSGNFSFVRISDDGLSLRFTRDNNVYIATRAATGAAFAPAQLLRGDAQRDFPARDGSGRFWSRNVDDNTTVFALRPADAPEGSAVRLGRGSPLWFEPATLTLWFYRIDILSAFPPRYEVNPYTARWNGSGWDGAQRADLFVEYTSPDACRIYGRQGTNVVVRSRVPPP